MANVHRRGCDCRWLHEVIHVLRRLFTISLCHMCFHWLYKHISIILLCFLQSVKAWWHQIQNDNLKAKKKKAQEKKKTKEEKKCLKISR